MNELQTAVLDATILQSILNESDGPDSPERGRGGSRNAGGGDAVPAVPAALALRRREDGTGDLYTQTLGADAVATLFGVTPRDLLRQRLGRASASASGRDGGGFPTDLRRGLLGPVSVPGAAMQVMAGAALAMKLRGEDRVALLLDGLPATSSGDWHEGFNFAAVSRAPLVVVLAPHPDPGIHTAVEGMAAKARAYGATSFAAPWEDADTILSTVREAVESARSGRGVALVEVALPTTLEGESVGTLQRTGLDRAAFETEVAQRTEAFRALLDEVRAEAEPTPDAVLGPVLHDQYADLPWTRSPQLRPR